jgi:branched-chain amino acid transport system substrate-binding protein
MKKSAKLPTIWNNGLRVVSAVIVISMALAACTTTTPSTVAPANTAAPAQTAAPADTAVPAATALPGTGHVIKIGVLAPMTGTSAADGEEMVRGAKLAVKEINAAGGILGYTFAVVSGDTQDQVPDAVVSAIQKLTADPDVNCMMTGYASTTNFEIQNMADMNMPYLVSANSAQTNGIIGNNGDKYPTIWSLTPTYDAYQTELPILMEKWATEGKITLNNRKVAIVTSDNPYSKTISDGLKKNFPAAGWTITVDETVPFQDVLDWRTIIAKIRQDPPDLVVNTDYLPANDASFLKQFLENPTPSFLFMQYGPSVPEFYDLTKEQSTGVLYNLLGGIIQSPKNTLSAEFLQKFKDEYGVESGSYGSSLYQSVYFYADALKVVGDPTNRLAVGKAIGNITRQTPNGTIKFDPTTHLAMQGDEFIPIQFYQFQSGTRVLIWPPVYATGDIIVPPWIK